MCANVLPQVLVKSTGERCYFPNTRLITLPVVNLTRSCARSEKVVVSLNVGQASNAARDALLVRRPVLLQEQAMQACARRIWTMRIV
jgi:hypothetical protein